MGENFNENLKEARIKSGLSQKEVSENIGVANQLILYMKVEIESRT